MKIVISLILLGTISHQESLATSEELYKSLKTINQYAEKNFNVMQKLKEISNTALVSFAKTEKLNTQLHSCQSEQGEHLKHKEKEHQNFHTFLKTDARLNRVLADYERKREKLTQELILKNKSAEEAYKKIVSLESHRKPTSLFSKFLAMFNKIPEPSPQDVTNSANVWSQSVLEVTTLKQQILELDSHYKTVEQELCQNTQLKNQFFELNKKTASALDHINANLNQTLRARNNELKKQTDLLESLKTTLDSYSSLREENPEICNGLKSSQNQENEDEK